MPKTVPWKDKEQWFKAYESGESVAKLSKESNKDPRTVQRGIEEVGDLRATQKVREVLFRDAHRFHQNELLGSVELGSQSVVSPPPHPDLGFQATESSRFHEFGPVRAHQKGGAFDLVTIGVEKELTWELLNEHLGRHDLFRDLYAWKRAFLVAMNAQMALRAAAVTALKTFGLELSDDLRQPGTLRPGGAEELLRAAVSRILSEDPPYGLRVNEGENEEFFVGGDTDQAEGEEFPVKNFSGGQLLPGGKDAREVMSGVLDSVTSGQAAESVRDTYGKADRATKEARRALELLRASHYIPGTCGACPRWGRT
jgi:hypothetical protein